MRLAQIPEHAMTDDHAAPFTTDDLATATTPTRLDASRFTLRVPEGWRQGRGTFGGLVLGALARAIETCEEDRARSLRSLTGEITGPVLAGDASLEVTALRRGSGVSTWSAVLTQAGEVLARATGVLGKTRMRDRDWSPPAPEGLGDWRAIADSNMGPPSGPEFIGNFEVRSGGPLPFTSAKDAVAWGWVRPRRTPTHLGAPEIVALADAWWPAALARESASRPASTIAFTLQMFPQVRALDPRSPLFHRAQAIAARDGFIVEMRELWSEHGELIALNQQTFVLIQ